MSTDYRATETESLEGDHVAICPICGTSATGDTHQAMYEATARHNEERHAGERIARPVKPTRKHIRAFLNSTARQYGSDVARELRRKMADVEPWGALDGE